MKVSNEDREKLKKTIAQKDWEMCHAYFDEMVLKRLEELDKEYYEDLMNITQKATFWYA